MVEKRKEEGKDGGVKLSTRKKREIKRKNQQTELLFSSFIGVWRVSGAPSVSSRRRRGQPLDA